MKTIGLIGGLSWESSAQYYRLLNEGVRARLGGLHSARILLLSLDFAPIAELQASGDWDVLDAQMADAARSLTAGGAELLLICANTMHLCAEAIVLGCTEIMLLVGEADSAVPLFDTLALHVDAAVDAAMAS